MQPEPSIRLEELSSRSEKLLVNGELMLLSPNWLPMGRSHETNWEVWALA
jgi:hypothetical protein